MSNEPDPVSLIQAIFGADEALAEDILLLTHWVDQELACERYGYPKDNAIPAPLAERLGNAEYVARLRAVACDHWEIGEDEVPF